MLIKKRSMRKSHLVAACVMTLAFTLIWTGCGSDREEVSEDNVTLKLKENRTEQKEVRTATGPGSDSIATPEVAEAEPAEEKIEREVSYGEAEDAYFGRDYREAVKLFTAYTEQKSGNPWGYYMLALSAWKMKDYQLAEESFTRALELNPGHLKSRINLCRVYLDTGRAREAIDLLEKVLEEEPEYADAYHLAGRGYRQLGETEKAVEHYRRAIQIDNGHVWAMNNLGLIFIREGEFEKALAPLARAAVLRDDIAVFQNNLGMALENTGRYRDAENAYAAAVTLDKSYDRAYNSLCRVELLEQEEGVTQIDLSEISEAFIQDINSRTEEDEQFSEAPDPVQADSSIAGTAEDFIKVAGADTTGTK
ncbi:MAG: tetratricopeptide repeat protein [Candidatus Krumholzibacteriales bacterium]